MEVVREKIKKHALSRAYFLLNMKKAFTLKRKGYKSDIGRSGGIRTHDLFHPKEALYQAEPRPESQGVLYRFIWILSTLFYKLF